MYRERVMCQTATEWKVEELYLFLIWKMKYLVVEVNFIFGFMRPKVKKSQNGWMGPLVAIWSDPLPKEGHLEHVALYSVQLIY